MSLARRVKQEEPYCRYCGLEVRYDVPVGHPDRGCVDHIIPLSQGGSPLARTNVTTSCHRCNGQKGDMTPEQWRAKQAGTAVGYSSLPRIVD